MKHFKLNFGNLVLQSSVAGISFSKVQNDNIYINICSAATFEQLISKLGSSSNGEVSQFSTDETKFLERIKHTLEKYKASNDADIVSALSLLEAELKPS